MELLTEQKAQTEARLASLNERWEKEKDLVTRIRELRNQIEAAAVAEPAPDVTPLRASLAELVKELEQLQGETPLIGVTVDAQIVGEVISGWTGIPVGKMLKDEIATVLALEKHLGARVIGQDRASG